MTKAPEAVLTVLPLSPGHETSVDVTVGDTAEEVAELDEGATIALEDTRVVELEDDAAALGD